MNAPTNDRAGRRWPSGLLVAAVAFAVAAVVGAYLDWILWIAYDGFMVTLAAGLILLIGGLVAVLGRGTARRKGLLALAVGIGLVAGQNLGPTREPLIYQAGGTMILRLESPSVAIATGPADCTNVASETEFAVSGDPNMTIETPKRRSISVYVNIGSRWDARDSASRKNGVRLDLLATDAEIQGDGNPTMVVMGLTDSSTLESSFSNAGGSLRFAGLVAQPRDDFTGPPVDLAGTLEWTCGAIVGEEALGRSPWSSRTVTLRTGSSVHLALAVLVLVPDDGTYSGGAWAWLRERNRSRT